MSTNAMPMHQTEEENVNRIDDLATICPPQIFHVIREKWGQSNGKLNVILFRMTFEPYITIPTAELALHRGGERYCESSRCARQGQWGYCFLLRNPIHEIQKLHGDLFFVHTDKGKVLWNSERIKTRFTKAWRNDIAFPFRNVELYHAPECPNGTLHLPDAHTLKSYFLKFCVQSEERVEAGGTSPKKRFSTWARYFTIHPGAN